MQTKIQHEVHTQQQQVKENNFIVVVVVVFLRILLFSGAANKANQANQNQSE